MRSGSLPSNRTLNPSLGESRLVGTVDSLQTTRRGEGKALCFIRESRSVQRET